jgi:hypothetical protein
MRIKQMIHAGKTSAVLWHRIRIPPWLNPGVANFTMGKPYCRLRHRERPGVVLSVYAKEGIEGQLKSTTDQGAGVQHDHSMNSTQLKEGEFLAMKKRRPNRTRKGLH